MRIGIVWVRSALTFETRLFKSVVHPTEDPIQGQGSIRHSARSLAAYDHQKKTPCQDVFSGNSPSCDRRQLAPRHASATPAGMNPTDSLLAHSPDILFPSALTGIDLKSVLSWVVFKNYDQGQMQKQDFQQPWE